MTLISYIALLGPLAVAFAAIGVSSLARRQSFPGAKVIAEARFGDDFADD